MKRRKIIYLVAALAVLLCIVGAWGFNKYQQDKKAREIEQICSAYIEKIKAVNLDDFELEIKAKSVENQEPEAIEITDGERQNIEVYLSSMALKNAMFLESLPPDGGASKVFCEVTLSSKNTVYRVSMLPNGAEFFISYMKHGTMLGYLQIDCTADQSATSYFMERLKVAPIEQ